MVVVLWIIVLYARLWQQRLWLSCQEAIEYGEEIGIQLQPTNLRGRLVSKGVYQDQNIKIQWCGGIYGEFSRFEKNGDSHTVDLIQNQEMLKEWLTKSTDTTVHLESISKPQSE